MAPSILTVAALVVTLNAVPNEPLAKSFVSTSGWTGGDGAYSAPLSKSRSLWLFGDSFIGRIHKGARQQAEFVNNTAGWLDQTPNGAYKFKYFWKRKADQAQSLLEPEAAKAYYWPSGMALSANKLALFCKVIVNKPGEDNTGFGFDWIGQELVLVENATDAPTQWRYKRVQLPGGEAEIMPGAACMVEGTHTFVYGTKKSVGGSAHKCVLMRIPTASLLAGDISKFEYWSSASGNSDKADWSAVPVAPVELFDGAPEMSVSRVEGLPGFWCVYSENGLGANILVRHADRPEGPWSEPMIAYRAPEAIRDKTLNCYGAKHHPELAREPRTMVVTYCLNPGGMAAHRTQPFVYFPRAVTISITPRTAQ